MLYFFFQNDILTLNVKYLRFSASPIPDSATCMSISFLSASCVNLLLAIQTKILQFLILWCLLTYDGLLMLIWCAS